MAHLFAGTSGFAYATWKPDFYPQKLAAKKFLEYYATRLNAVEINYTFRQLPKAATLEGWVKQVEGSPFGKDFRFICKAHQRITHIHRLKESEFTDLFFKALEPLRASRRLGPVLFQLPPNLKVDAALLQAFLAKLPEDIRCAFEFRNATWLVDEVYRLLEQHGAALCLAESPKLEVSQVVTANFIYARLRMGEYSVEERAAIAARAGEQLAQGRDVYAFFKHEDSPAGALYAEELLKRVTGKALAEGDRP
jgi:uncharacterized protein YecE (DUF72 family)